MQDLPGNPGNPGNRNLRCRTGRRHTGGRTMAIALTSLRQVNYCVALSLTASTPRAQAWVLFPAVSSGMTACLAPAGVDIYAACGSAGMFLANITLGTLPVTVLHAVLRQSATRRRCSSCVRFASGRCAVLNDTAYTFASGTSMAVPLAAGLAAIYLAGTLQTTKTVHGALQSFRCRRKLLRSADSVNQGQQWQLGGRSQAGMTTDERYLLILCRTVCCRQSPGDAGGGAGRPGGRRHSRRAGRQPAAAGHPQPAAVHPAAANTGQHSTSSASYFHSPILATFCSCYVHHMPGSVVMTTAQQPDPDPLAGRSCKGDVVMHRMGRNECVHRNEAT